MARPWIEFLFAQHLPWLPGGLPGGTRADAEAKILSADPARGDCSVLLRYPAGWSRPDGEALAAEEEMYVLDGAIEINGRSYGRDTYACFPPGHVRRSAASQRGCVTLTFFDRKPVLATSAADADAQLIEFIDVTAMRWDTKTADPTLEWMGNRRKVLKWDRDYDQKGTFVFSTPPHTFPENWRCPTLTHPCVEESFKLAGDMIGPQGRMTAGAYFWRPAGIPHGPFGSHDGSLSIIRFKYGKHINVWDKTPVRFSFDTPYKPALPPELAPYNAVYQGGARY